MKFRIDIQALRGWAVLSVVLYHADLGFLTGGFLGVDIFFVISGFLITGIIKKSIEQDTFTFSGFYYRRAKRLLPASYVTFFITALLAPVFLTISELQDFKLQLFGAITYSANIFLWLQTGYFEGAAELKPLLHIWSLSIEEQYYLLLPAALVFTPRRYWATGAWMITISSLTLCLMLVSWKTNSTFYLLPTRAWELALGSAGTLALNKEKIKNFLSYFNAPAIAVLFLIPVFPFGGSHPGLDAILVCLATLVILVARPTLLNTGPLARTFAKVGDFSYSLYLVHWPLFAFAQNIYLSNVPLNIRFAILILSLILGYLLFRYVELPIRRSNIEYSPKLLIATLTVSATIILTPMVLITNQGSQKKFAEIIRANLGFGKECNFEDNFVPKKKCRNSDNPLIMVWGDSFAMHLVPGIRTSTNQGIIQATRDACGPFIGLASISDGLKIKAWDGMYNRAWAEQCLQFNQSVFKYLASKKSIKIVVLSSPFRAYLYPPEMVKYHLLQKTNNKLKVVDGGMKIAVEALAQTVKKLRLIGKKVVIVAPPPRVSFNIGKCLERNYNNKMILGNNSDCSFSVEKYHSKQKLVLDFLGNIKLQANVNVVTFDNFLCPEKICRTVLDDTIIYRDNGHLSYSGSKLLGQKLDLGETLIRVAS